MDRLLETPDSAALLVSRVVLGLVMFAHGAQKLFGWFGGPGPSATVDAFSHGMGLPAFVPVLVILAETLGALGLILGALARVAAAGILVEMLGAVAVVHAPNGFFMNWSGHKTGEGFEYHLLAMALALAVLVEGAGALSVDRAVYRLLQTRTRRAIPTG